MEQLLGTTIGVYITITIFVIGFAAYMTGQALAVTWRPTWQLIAYCCLLGFADRFLTFALYEGQLLSMSGYIIDTATITLIGFVSFRAARAKKMVAQYPWIYDRDGPFSWREKGP